MSVIGMIEYNWENADHHKQYVLPMFVPGCAEFMMMNDKQVEEHPILADFFEICPDCLWKGHTNGTAGRLRNRNACHSCRKAIPAKQESASVEHISHWLKNIRTNMQSAPVPAAVSNACAAKAAAKSKEICASVSVIWQIIW